MTEKPTDLITDHPFQASPWPDICGHRGEEGDWMCGFGAAEHAERPEGAHEEVTPDGP